MVKTGKHKRKYPFAQRRDRVRRLTSLCAALAARQAPVAKKPRQQRAGARRAPPCARGRSNGLRGRLQPRRQPPKLAEPLPGGHIQPSNHVEGGPAELRCRQARRARRDGGHQRRRAGGAAEGQHAGGARSAARWFPRAQRAVLTCAPTPAQGQMATQARKVSSAVEVRPRGPGLAARCRLHASPVARTQDRRPGKACRGAPEPPARRGRAPLPTPAPRGACLTPNVPPCFCPSLTPTPLRAAGRCRCTPASRTSGATGDRTRTRLQAPGEPCTLTFIFVEPVTAPFPAARGSLTPPRRCRLPPPARRTSSEEGGLYAVVNMRGAPPPRPPPPLPQGHNILTNHIAYGAGKCAPAAAGSPRSPTWTARAKAVACQPICARRIRIRRRELDAPCPAGISRRGPPSQPAARPSAAQADARRPWMAGAEKGRDLYPGAAQATSPPRRPRALPLSSRRAARAPPRLLGPPPSDVCPALQRR